MASGPVSGLNAIFLSVLQVSVFTGSQRLEHTLHLTGFNIYINPLESRI